MEKRWVMFIDTERDYVNKETGSKHSTFKAPSSKFRIIPQDNKLED